MTNHLEKYYTNLFFISALAFGTVVTSLLSSFAEMLERYDASFTMDILLSGFNGVMIIAILKGWRCIDREVHRRLNRLPLNQLEKEWLEKNSRYLRFVKQSQPAAKPIRPYAKASRIKINALLAVALLANIVSLTVHIGFFGN